MNELFNIKEKVIVVTGATGVLAGNVARYLAKNGAKVAFIGRNLEKLESAKAYCKDNELEALFFQCDVLNEEQLVKVREEIFNKWGHIEILINGAGGNRSDAVVMPDQDFFDMSVEAWQSVMDLNLRGTLLPSLVFGRHFSQSKKGAIVNFSSMSSSQALSRVMGYSNAKASIDNMTKWLATELATKLGEFVRVNAVCPGFFISEQNKSLLLNQDGSLTQRGSQIIAKTPFKRFGKEEEVNGAVHFLCSEASKFITGTILPIDGGFSSFTGV